MRANKNMEVITMSIVKWSPVSEIVSEFFSSPSYRDWTHVHPSFFHTDLKAPFSGYGSPRIEIKERKDAYIIRAELPGVSKDDIDITVTHDVLRLKGEAKAAEETVSEECYCSERSYGAFDRTVPLPTSVDKEKITSSLKDGLLEIVLPKKEEAKVQELKIAVK
ncbi:heat shock protein Hsp20 [Candidatus Magnetoovum chiemensis]|nr:heat shock protein Hsp20 [Candidatus Magnetoovum chiemensis]